MKAIRVHSFGGPEVLMPKDVPIAQPGPGQVLVRVKAIGVNPVDTYIRSGGYARKPDLPYTPGSDASGVIEAVGQGVSTLEVGNRVYTSGSLTGTYAELTLCNESQIHLLPENTTFPQGAALGVPYATAYRALFQRALAKQGETILVHGGSGGVGIAAIQFGKSAGLSVIATAGTEMGRELAAAQGANLILDHRAPHYLENLMTLTGNRGVDIILEMLANVNLSNDLKILAPKGRVVVIGNRGTVEIDPRDLMGKESAILGMMLFGASEAEMRDIHRAITNGLTKGTLNPVIGKEFPLKDAADAHRAIMDGAVGAKGKIVLIP
jgi:NADPH:quinone reductase